MWSRVAKVALVAVLGVSQGVLGAVTPRQEQLPAPTDLPSAQLILSQKRLVNLLADIRFQVPYPIGPPQPNGTVQALNGSDIQGDILVGMKKQKELFLFFKINNVKSFKAKLHNQIVPFVTSSAQLQNILTQPITALNIAFSQTGLTTLGITDNLGDTFFTAGQFADLFNLGDPAGNPNIVPAFAGTSIHGVFLIASDQQIFVDALKLVILAVFGTDITDLYELQGNVRPAPFAGHEMFGYADGIAQPFVTGWAGTPFPGQLSVNPGVILLGEPGDPITRPSWAKDGSFLAFRQLKQLVPEFNNFVVTNAPVLPGKTPAQSADILGARMVGRWKSGAPTDLNPLTDNPTQGSDPMQNNNFDYTHTGFSLVNDQSHCPFDAHIRKTHPRADLSAPDKSIMRAGIPYGPEPTTPELSSGVTASERGLAFVSYQAQIGSGFRFLQQAWANNPNFIFGKNVSQPGFDPIIGANHGGARFMNGYKQNDASLNLNLPFDFVVSRGGEYFFSPSISALKNKISV